MEYVQAETEKQTTQSRLYDMIDENARLITQTNIKETSKAWGERVSSEQEGRPDDEEEKTENPDMVEKKVDRIREFEKEKKEQHLEKARETVRLELEKLENKVKDMEANERDNARRRRERGGEMGCRRSKSKDGNTWRRRETVHDNESSSGSMS